MGEVVRFGGEHRKPFLDGPRVVAMSKQAAKDFFGFDDDPVDLGPPADHTKYLPGAHVFVFTRKRASRAR